MIVDNRNIEQHKNSTIYVSHSGDYEEFYLLGYNAV
jgi:hypothetical protein